MNCTSFVIEDHCTRYELRLFGAKAFDVYHRTRLVGTIFNEFGMTWRVNKYMERYQRDTLMSSTNQSLPLSPALGALVSKYILWKDAINQRHQRHLLANTQHWLKPLSYTHQHWGWQPLNLWVLLINGLISWHCNEHPPSYHLITNAIAAQSRNLCIAIPDNITISFFADELVTYGLSGMEILLHPYFWLFSNNSFCRFVINMSFRIQ